MGDQKIIMVAVAMPAKLYERLRVVCAENELTKSDVGLFGFKRAIRDLEKIKKEVQEYEVQIRTKGKSEDDL